MTEEADASAGRTTGVVAWLGVGDTEIAGVGLGVVVTAGDGLTLGAADTVSDVVADGCGVG